MKKLLALLLTVVLLFSGFSIVNAETKESMDKTIVNVCSIFWNNLKRSFNIGNITPQDCSWIYMQYNNRYDIFEQINDHPNDIQCFNWLPKEGYIIILGKMIFLCDKNVNIVGYYSDKDDWQVINRNSNLKTLEKMMEETYIQLFFSGYALRAFFPTSFSDIEGDSLNNVLCSLTDKQIQRIR